MKAHGFLILLFVCLAVPAFSQSRIEPQTVATANTVAGVVIDDRTEKPIRGVLIYIENHILFAETDASGRFVLTVPAGPQTIAASVLGYALVRADIEVAAAPLEMTIRLSEGAGSYSERVTVSGTRRDDSEAVPGGTELHGRELESLRGVMLDDPLRAVQALPSATATDDFYSEFAVRGNSFRHVGLAVDGIPTRYLMHSVHGVADGGSIAMVNSETLGAVSLLPGSYPQRTGRRLGAQVDLSTREGNREEFRGRAGLSGTSATFLGEGPIAGGRGSWLASVRRSYLDYIIKRIEPDASFAFGFVDAQTKLAYDVSPRHQLAITMLLGRAAFEEGAGDVGENDEASATSHAWLAALSWRFIRGPQFALTQRLYSTGLQFDNANRSGATLDAAKSTDLGWRADASFAPSARWLVEFGADAQRLAARNVMARQLSVSSGQITLNHYDERASAASAYGQVRVGVGARFHVTPGVRVDYWTLTRSTTASPWINAALRLGDATRVRAGSGVYRQFADLDQVHGIRGGGTGLRPERALHIDAGIEHTLPRGIRLLLNGYARHEHDVLWTPGSEPRRLPNGTIVPGFSDARWANVLRGRARGVEVVARRDAPDGLSGWAGYAYSRLQYTETVTSDTFSADADQRHTVTVYGNYRLSNRTSLSGKFRYGSNYPMVGYIGAAPASLEAPPIVDGQPAFHGLVGTRNSLRLPAYSRVDVRADRAFNWSARRLVLFVEVANSLNRTNLRNTPYGVDRAGRVFGATESLMPIVPSAGFVIEF